MVKHGLPVVFLIAVIGSCLTAQAREKTPPSPAPPELQTPQVIVVSQPDSPLLVTTSHRWAVPGVDILDLYVVVKNRDTKSIRAFTTRIDFPDRKPSEACVIDNIYFTGKVMKQDEGDGKSRFVATKNAPAIQVSVDYVEFVDGSTWGQDTCHTVEFLAGERAGGDAAIKWFKNLIEEKGTKAVVEIIRSRSVSVEKPYSASARWDEGFRNGVVIISRRVMDAHDQEGEAEVAAVLSKPYDASMVKQ